ncbi:hypothetical protein [Microbulbifer guangxiensis]|uniref:hypothetical protein n=1 Tax=Microbulbifer guangxiensis TaxID=2904249 RepID=UPI001F484743|nr:hypothetical protein [Microbulbifer guangxiensis]
MRQGIAALGTALAALLLTGVTVSAEESRQAEFSPTILSAESDSTVLGLSYELASSGRRNFAAPPAPDSDAWEDPEIDALEWGYILKGVLTGNPDDNPENFAELDLHLNYSRLALDLPVQEFGAVYKYEADQSFDNKQSLVGLRYTAHISRMVAGTYRTSGDLFVRATLGKVSPISDAAREALLGASMERYNRWDAIALYKLPTRDWLGDFSEDLEISYRYFEEISPPDAVREAGLDSFDYLSVVLNLKNNLFVAYTEGELPTDLDEDKTFKLGWSWELGELVR